MIGKKLCGIMLMMNKDKNKVATTEVSVANAAEDGRITYISLTEEGRKLSEKYNENYFAGLAPYLESI